jgi:hypothetical protein
MLVICVEDLDEFDDVDDVEYVCEDVDGFRRDLRH